MNQEGVLKMKIIFIVPADDKRRTMSYRVGGKIYGHSSSITGPLILGRILKEAGHKVEVYEELYKDIDLSICDDADVIGLHTMTSSAPRAYEIADKLKGNKGQRVILGGIHASSLPEEASRHADQVIVGEAENVIKDVVAGNTTDRIVHASNVSNLDEVPFPDYSLLKTPCDAANIMTTRGCPFSCKFCTTSRMFYPYRERSVDNVIEELQYYKKLGFQYINFQDDNFTANKQRAKALLCKMIENNLIFKEVFFFGRTDMAKDEELLQLLRKANFNRVLVGIESLNQQSLDYIDKRQTIADIEKCGRILEKYQIRLIASLVLGLDNDTAEDIRRGVAFCQRIHAYQLQPAVLTPFPGTPVYRQFVDEHRMLTDNWRLFDMMNVTFQPLKMSAAELQREFFRALKTFYGFFSSFEIMKIFGFNSGLRRLGLWLLVRIGMLFLRFYLVFDRSHYYNKLAKLGAK